MEIQSNELRYTPTRFLIRVLRFLRDPGVQVQRVMTDNGTAYRPRAFAKACRGLDLQHKRTRPYTPTSGQAERFTQTLLRQRAYQRAYPTQACAMPPCLHGCIDTTIFDHTPASDTIHPSAATVMCLLRPQGLGSPIRRHGTPTPWQSAIPITVSARFPD